MSAQTPGHSTLLRLIRQSSSRALVIIVTVALLPWAQMEAGSTLAAVDHRGPTIPERAGAIQSGQETQSVLEPGKPVEREIAGGQEHAYRIALQAGQFMRLIVEPKGMGLLVSLTAPGGKAVETNYFVNTSALDSFSFLADSSGEARLTARSRGAGTIYGSYRLRLEVRTPTEDDRKRFTAEDVEVAVRGPAMVDRGSFDRPQNRIGTEQNDQCIRSDALRIE